MVSFYVSAIKYGYMSIEDVPDIYKDEVNELLS